MGLIRIFLVICVVLVHNGINEPGIHGNLSVMAFFLISGFYMALVLNERYQDNTRGFYLARYLRLWPGYFVVMLMTVYFYPFQSMPTLAGIWAYFSSIVLFFQETLWWVAVNKVNGSLVWFGPNEPGGPALLLVWFTRMAHMWSVGIELLFYLAAPFIACKPRRIIVVFVAAYAVHAWMLYALPFDHPLQIRSAAGFFWLFALGMLSYWIWRALRDNLPKIGKSWYMPVLGVAATYLCIAGAQLTLPATGAPLLLSDLFLMIFAAVVIFAFQITSKISWDRTIGELSYPLYLVHWPIVALWVTDHRGDWLWSLALVSLSLAIAGLLHLIAERPVEKIRRRLQGPAKAFSPQDGLMSGVSATRSAAVRLIQPESSQHLPR